MYNSFLQSTSEVCHFVAGSPLALDDFEVIEFVGNFKVNFGFENSNFITASIAIIVESFSFVFVAFLDPSGDSFIIGVRWRRMIIMTMYYMYTVEQEIAIFIAIFRMNTLYSKIKKKLRNFNIRNFCGVKTVCGP